MDVVKHIKNNMTGRMCDEQNNINYLLNIVRIAGNGNYLEIGTLHGGSLCAVALWKKEHKQSGICYAIDPLDGYYMDYIDHRKRGLNVDPLTKLPVSIDIVKENLKKFGLTRAAKIIQAKSEPFPIDGVKFAVTYIDGDHWSGAPLRDWDNVKDITSGFVVFDNYDEDHPDVMEAAHQAAWSQEWVQYMQTGITFVVRRKA